MSVEGVAQGLEEVKQTIHTAPYEQIVDASPPLTVGGIIELSATLAATKESLMGTMYASVLAVQQCAENAMLQLQEVAGSKDSRHTLLEDAQRSLEGMHDSAREVGVAAAAMYDILGKAGDYLYALDQAITSYNESRAGAQAQATESQMAATLACDQLAAYQQHIGGG
jgi:hypothetical protein